MPLKSMKCNHVSIGEGSLTITIEISTEFGSGWV